MLNKTFVFWLMLGFILKGWASEQEAGIQQQPSFKAVLTDFEQACSSGSASITRNELKQLQAFYAAFNFVPQWNDSSRREELSLALSELAADGLNPELYPIPASTFDTDYCADIFLSNSYLNALLALQNGVLDPQKVEPYWFDAKTQSFSWKTVNTLAAMHVSEPAKAFAEARPQLAVYQSLRSALEKRLSENVSDWVEVPVKSYSLKPNATDDERTPILRARLLELNYLKDKPKQELDVIESSIFEPSAHLIAEQATQATKVEEKASLVLDHNVYDATMVEAVKAFQRDHRLADDGIVGPATLKQVNISPEQRNQQIAINLERIRWVNNLMEPTLLLTDIAGAQLNYIYNGKSVWKSRGQVGSIARKTPLMKSHITHLTLNPTWTVPPTIYRRDTLPAIQRDIGYLERRRMTVLDMQGNRLNPYEIDWSNPGAVMLRQAAGPSNALGQVAIRFPNPFMVYLHDTPSQALFDRANRSVSSGCVRVENIQYLIDLLFQDAGSALQNKVKQVQDSGRTQNVSLAKPIPVLLAYWTASVEEDGRLQFRSDIYNYDQDLIKAWKKAVAL